MRLTPWVGGAAVLALLALAWILWPAPEASAPAVARVEPPKAAADGTPQYAPQRPATPIAAPVPNAPAAATSARAASLAPLPPANLPLAEAYPALKALAQQGDARASCRLAFELERCNRLPSLRGAAAFWRDSAAKSAPNAHSQQLIASAEAQLQAAEAACKGFPAEEGRQAWDYALAAATAGNREARYMVASLPPGLDPQRPENTLEGWSQWRDAIGSILAAGVADGDPRMLALAARAHRLPVFGFQALPPDPLRAVALQMAIQMRSANAYRPTIDRDVRYAVAEARLDAAAEAKARTLAETFTVRAGPEGIDWSRGMGVATPAEACEAP